jgi:uncharacterized protein
LSDGGRSLYQDVNELRVQLRWPGRIDDQPRSKQDKMSGMFGIDFLELAGLFGLLVAAGAATGLLAGLFGVGGGAISVPILFFVFERMGVVESVAMPLAVGTSLAIIVPTSMRSAKAHRARGAVDEAVLKAWRWPILIGVVAGAAIARYAEPWVFQLVFVLVASTNAVKLLFGGSTWQVSGSLPTGVTLQAYGAVAGLFSALMGIGGGAITNLMFTLHSKPIHQAVATSAAAGVLISIPGALGYVLAGLGRQGLPPLSLGFVSLTAAACLVPAALLTTPIGVRIAHRLGKRQLEIAFGCFLALVSLRFIHALLT